MNPDYIQSLLLYHDVSVGLYLRRKKKQKNTIYMINPREIKAVNMFYKYYQFLSSMEMSEHKQKSPAWRGIILAIFHRQKLYCEQRKFQLIPTKRAGACSCQVPAECLWWRREAHSQGTARKQQGRCELWSKPNTATPGMSVLPLYCPTWLLCRAEQKTESNQSIFSWNELKSHRVVCSCYPGCVCKNSAW